MRIDLCKLIDMILDMQEKFNASDDPVKRYALLQAINHVLEKQAPLHGYIEDMCREAMIRKITGIQKPVK